jgi:hypothetical protein
VLSRNGVVLLVLTVDGESGLTTGLTGLTDVTPGQGERHVEATPCFSQLSNCTVEPLKLHCRATMKVIALSPRLMQSERTPLLKLQGEPTGSTLSSQRTMGTKIHVSSSQPATDTTLSNHRHIAQP